MIMAAAAVVYALHAAPGAPAASAAEAAWRHDLDVSLDPATHTLRATDTIVAGSGAAAASPLRFALHSGLKIASLRINGAPALSRLHSSPHPEKSHLTLWSGPDTAPGARIVVVYEGTINDPVTREGQLGFVAGDSTAGVISPAGVFLDGGTGWVPIVDGPLARYDISARAPSPWVIVTQGRRDARASRWTAEVPSDGLALVAGRYVVKSIDHGGVTISAYFFEEEASLAEAFLEKVPEYLDRFSALLTPYPYSSFDIVENFFTTGYGYPGFTLLGQDVIRMGPMALRPGYVDHEVMHCWWGNYVYPDPGSGNWSEGLTTYFANYMAQEAAGGSAAADYRRGIAMKYALRVTPELDYPLSRFTHKTREVDNEIGYGKAAMVFHMLRRRAGDDTFFSVMRQMAERFGGRRAAWGDFKAAFEAATGQDLSAFFSAWLDGTGLPSVSITRAQAERAPGGYRVTGTLTQAGAAWKATVPLVVDTPSGPRGQIVESTSATTDFSIETDALPVSLRLDPEMNSLRALPHEEIPACLNASLESPRPLFVVPARRMENAEDPYRQLAETMAAVRQGEVISDEGAGRETLQGRSLILLGPPEENRATSMLLSAIRPALSVTGTRITLGERTFSGEEHSLLLSARHPWSAGRFVTIYFGLSPAALGRSRNVPFYGWDTWVAFKAGVPAGRDTLWPETDGSVRLLAPDLLTLPEGIPPERLLEDVAALAAPAMEGRRAGSSGAAAAARWIETSMRQAGLQPAGEVAPFFDKHRHAFTLATADLDPEAAESGAVVTLRRFSGERSFPAQPLAIPGPASVGPTDEAFIVPADDLACLASAASVPKLEGAILFTVERSLPEPSTQRPDRPGDPRGRPEIDSDAARLLADQLVAAGRLGASALILLRPSEGASRYESLMSFPSAPSAPDAAAIAERRKGGEFAGADMFFSGRISRLPFAATLPQLLVMSAGPAIGEALMGKQAFRREARREMMLCRGGFSPVILDATIGATAALRRTERQGVNIAGWLQGADPVLRREVVIVTAHYDAMGMSEQGMLLPGASDNAAGVAALLAAARHFSAPQVRPRRSLMLVATDAEEWGLAGSRALVARLPELALSPAAVVNLDSLGSGDPSRVFLIGGSHRPELRRVVAALAPLAGLELGRDIDPFAFDYGSDYYPFHLAGLPSVGFFAADYRSLHRAADSFETVGGEPLARAARLAILTVAALGG